MEFVLRSSEGGGRGFLVQIYNLFALNYLEDIHRKILSIASSPQQDRKYRLPVFRFRDKSPSFLLRVGGGQVSVRYATACQERLRRVIIHSMRQGTVERAEVSPLLEYVIDQQYFFGRLWFFGRLTRLSRRHEVGGVWAEHTAFRHGVLKH